MKIMICSSRHLYDQVNEIKNKLQEIGHDITLPNCFEEPLKEERMKETSEEDHIKFKQEMMKLHEPKIKEVDAILVMNHEKNGQPNYIGGATFMEIIKAWELEKKVFLLNPIPDNLLRDEIHGINPIILNGDLSLIK
jgi:hypothetical protein